MGTGAGGSMRSTDARIHGAIPIEGQFNTNSRYEYEVDTNWICLTASSAY